MPQLLASEIISLILQNYEVVAAVSSPIFVQNNL
jgi:hypothetical protein